MNPLSIAGAKEKAARESLPAIIHAQLESNQTKSTRDDKPYLELAFVDSSDRFTLRIWSDHPAFTQMRDLTAGEFFEIAGEFGVHPVYGLEVRKWSTRELEDPEKDALLQGDEDQGRKVRDAFERIGGLVETLHDPRLQRLCRKFLEEHGERFQRTAAARHYHHARRGGLVEHTAQMMETASRICEAYPRLNRDLLLAGCLFHDCGKLWENSYPPDGFLMPYEELGELLGHITIGVEVVNRLCHQLESEFKESPDLTPPFEEVRLHLMHLIASHHGELEFGSPVHPKTPEAIALHHLDNLDAKLEMLDQAYHQGHPLNEKVVERVRPLPSNLVRPLTPAPPQNGV